MILICGGLADPVTELVCARLNQLGHPYRLLDLGAYPSGFRIAWRWQGERPEGHIAGPGWHLDLAELTGVYARYLGPAGRLPPPELGEDAGPALFAEYDAGLTALLEDLPCAVVNRLAGGVSNHSKPYQALLARQCGLRTPPTLVTNDAAALHRFRDEHHGELIYKSLSSVRSIVKRVEEEQLARLPLLRHGPAQFQAFIPGENVRVHTVGEQLFATRVISTAVDYRYAHREGSDMAMAATTVPPAIAQACRRLARLTGLLLSGIDLKRTPDGEYYCFEINPSPGFLYYERNTRQPISAALADLLRRGVPADLQPSCGAPAGAPFSPPLHPQRRIERER